jgi:hypothetical protein
VDSIRLTHEDWLLKLEKLASGNKDHAWEKRIFGDWNAPNREMLGGWPPSENIHLNCDEEC